MSNRNSPSPSMVGYDEGCEDGWLEGNEAGCKLGFEDGWLVGVADGLEVG